MSMDFRIEPKIKYIKVFRIYDLFWIYANKKNIYRFPEWHPYFSWRSIHIPSENQKLFSEKKMHTGV